MKDREELMNTATRSGRHAGIIETARSVMDRGIDRRSERMVDLIRAAFRAANRHEAEAAAEFATKVFMEERILGDFVEKGLLLRTDKFEDGWRVYARHPRIDCARPTHGLSTKRGTSRCATQPTFRAQLSHRQARDDDACRSPRING
jgi:hypothetical protein